MIRKKLNELRGVLWPMPEYTPFFLILLSALWLTGCSGSEAGPTPYLPPTLAAPTQPAATPTQPPPTPTAAVVECQDNLSFKEDLTVPDGTYVRPGAVMDKRWQVENSGTCNWDERYRLKLVDGPAMETNPEQALFPARSGAQVVIRVVFTAPAENGRYRSAWQAVNPEGAPFGDLIFIEVIVEGP